MEPRRPPATVTARARSLREKATRSEGLLWSLLRSQQLCGLKFRRQHPIGPWFADFACVQKKLAIEIDGGYHDATNVQDLNRQKHLAQLGWRVIRFSSEEVEEDAVAVTRAIAYALDLPYEFRKRKATGSGMQSVKAAMPKRKNYKS